MSPLVSVLMPVYNARPYVDAAIQSMLRQTLTDFEFIIIDDGSTDGTNEILKRYAMQDERIRLIQRENRGLIHSLNEGIDLAHSEYVARMDADDLSMPHRLETQWKFLQQNPDVGILGSRISHIDERGDLSKRRARLLPLSSDVIRWYLLFGNCVAHPTVMMRRSVLRQVGSYRSGMKHVEDFDLWLRASRITQIVNLPEALVFYRVNTASVSSQNNALQAQLARSLRADFIEDVVGVVPCEESLKMLEPVTGPLHAVQQTKTPSAARLVIDIYRRYCERTALSAADKNEIGLDVLRRIALLSSARRIGLRERLQTLQYALPVLPNLFSLQTLRSFERLTQGAEKVEPDDVPKR